jgi:pyruvate/2-oxoglutarate dehydrogenase complex dihydrolipoamide dehydrogenase (E3) component
MKSIQHAKEWGVAIGSGPSPISIDMAQVHAQGQDRRRSVKGSVSVQEEQDHLDQGDRGLTGGGGVDVFEGDAQTLRARKEIIVATGSAPQRAGRRDRSSAHHYQ